MCPYFIHNFSQYVSHAKCSDWKLLEKKKKKKTLFTSNWPLVTLDNRTLFIKLVALHDVHSVLLVLFWSDIHKQHYRRKCQVKFHLWPPITRPPITREPGVRFTWELVYSTELIEVYHIPKIDQLLSSLPVFSQNKHFLPDLTFALLTLGSDVAWHADSKKQQGKSVRPS